jgi:hypothetical protein
VGVAEAQEAQETPATPATPATLALHRLKTAFRWLSDATLLWSLQTGKWLFLGTRNKMNDKELQKELDRRNKLRQLENLEANDSRAQSITVGTAGGGTTEITMRSASGKFLWNTYQPVEVIELIHQLSANVGCHLQLVPRQDFAAWRDWKVSDEELAKARGIQHTPGVGFSPFPKYDAEKYLSNGANLPHPDEQVGRQKIEVKEQENVATKKAVNKRSTKRSRTTTK